MIPNWLKLMWAAIKGSWKECTESAGNNSKWEVDQEKLKLAQKYMKALNQDVEERRRAEEEAGLALRTVMVAKLDTLEAEIAERYGKALSQAESACLLNMLYHVKLERIFRGL
jgi:hypothetical protein